MKSLGAAMVSALLGIAGVYYGLSKFGKFDPPAALQVAMAVVGAVPYIREFFDKAPLIQQGSRMPAVLSIGDFGLRPKRMILYGTLIVLGAMNLGSGAGGWSAGVIGVSTDHQVLLVMGIVAYLIQFPVIFAVGRWVGRRCASHGLVTIVLISFFARLAAALLDMALLWLMPDKRRAVLGPSTLAFSARIVGGTILISLVAFVGYWLGRRQRVAAYLSYLLETVPTDTRKVIIDLAFEEARATRTPGGQASSP